MVGEFSTIGHETPLTSWTRDLEEFRRDKLQFWTRRGYRDVLEDGKQRA